MSVKKEESGRRSVQVEVEVPGTPEEVWQAIATGPGVSSWFVPTDIDVGAGTVTANFGPGMDSVATITSWEAPNRFAAESPGWGPNMPSMATEWIVEARDGGTCIVRVVHSMFASTDDWDNQLESVESGWPAFFRILRLYLTHFRGQPCSSLRAMAMSPEPVSKVWDTLTGPLGLAAATAGQRCSAAAGVPPLAGVVDQVHDDTHPSVLLVIDQPVPGALFATACSMGSQVYVGLNFYLYGEGAAGVAARDEPLWQAWMKEHFPSLDHASTCGA